MVNLSFIPRARIAEHLEAGWRPALRDEEYIWTEYAVLMVLPVDPVPATASLVKAFLRIFARPVVKKQPNVIRAAIGRNEVRYRSRKTGRFVDPPVFVEAAE